MANLIWTAILYFSTSAIVLVTYRTFVNDRKAENEAKTNAVVFRAQAKSREQAELAVKRPAARRPRTLGQATAAR